jgi:hypothetical protein
MTPLDSLLRSSFEDWAESHWAEGLNCYWDEDEQEFSDGHVQTTWEGYKEATRKLLESLVLGVEATREGAAVVLMAKVKDVTLVLKSEYVAVNKPIIGWAISPKEVR